MATDHCQHCMTPYALHLLMLMIVHDCKRAQPFYSMDMIESNLANLPLYVDSCIAQQDLSFPHTVHSSLEFSFFLHRLCGWTTWSQNN